MWDLSCAFHDYFTSKPILNGAPIKYAVVPERPECAPNQIVKNYVKGNDDGLEAVFHVAYHEIVEAMTNPTVDGFYVRDSNSDFYPSENADLCELSFGTVCKPKNGAYYNTIIGGVKYILQTNYDPKLRQCKNFGRIVKPRPGESCKTITPEF